MIPVHHPHLTAADVQAVQEALRSGHVSGSSGKFIEEFEERFAAYIGVAHAVAVNSGTAAIHTAMLALQLDSVDVLMSASTNIASANPVVLTNSRVVPVDSDPATWVMDTKLLEQRTTPFTRAVMPVHLYGQPVDMPAVMAFAKELNLAVIEDCAHALGAEVGGRKVGSFGDIGCFSFGENKTITAGEGGMVVTNSRALADRAKLARNLASVHPPFLHYSLGFNYRMTNVAAALGLSQFKRLDDVLEAKRNIAIWYTRRLQHLPGLKLPVERSNVRNVFWSYGVVVDSTGPVTRQKIFDHLTRRQVDYRTMCCPMTLQPVLKQRDLVMSTACPVALDQWQHGLYLPSSPILSEAAVNLVCDAVESAYDEA